MRNTSRVSTPISGRLSLLLPLLLGSMTSAAQAQFTNTWTGMATGNTKWSATANWNASGVPTSGASTALDFTGTVATSVNDLTGAAGGPFQLNLMQFDVTSTVLTLSGNALSFVSNGGTAPTLVQNSKANVGINNNLMLGNNLTVNLQNYGELTLGGAISGTGSLTVTAAQTDYLMVISNAANSYSGGTNFNGGILKITSDGALGAASGGLTFNGGTLEFGANNITTARTVTLGTNGGTVETLTTVGSPNTDTLSGVISGSGTLTTTGFGTVVLSNSGNSYTGGTIIAGGTLQLGADNALTSGKDLTLTATNNDAALDLNGHSVTIGNLTLGDGVSTQNNLTITDSAPTSTNALILNGNITYNPYVDVSDPANPIPYTPPAYVNSTLSLSSGQHVIGNGNSGLHSDYLYPYDVVINGKVTGAGGLNIGSLTDTQEGALIVLTNGANNYKGDTNINNGQLYLGAKNALPATTNVTVSALNTSSAHPVSLYLYIDSGTIDPNNPLSGVNPGSYDQTIGSLGDGANNTGGGYVYLGSSTLTVGGNNLSTTFSGTIADNDGMNMDSLNGGSLTKIGTGTLTLSGVNTYTGATTVMAGTLQLGADNTLPVTDLILSGGAFDTNGKNQELNNVTNSGGAMLVRNNATTLTIDKDYVQSAGTTQITAASVNVDGAYTQTGGTTQVDGTLNGTPGNDLNVTGGELVGTGKIGNATLNNTAVTLYNSTNGIVRPGDLLPSVTVGTLTVNGNYVQQAGGTLEIDIASKTSYGILQAYSASLAGTLDIKLLNGFSLQPGDQFDFLQLVSGKNGTITGNFTTINGLTGDTYTISGGILTVETAGVPESSTLLSAALMLSAGGLLLRRQRRVSRKETAAVV